ncbi:hypothetical protein A4244_19210 [Bacillus badius]|nr:hypothetical protein A4244_19210 [Bacillus badius]KZR59157.1 hypothetical protein A3781_14320 [Bacillus badius]OCS84358.1 hypothetical protein A6M11_19225 [Bacillus badius]OVE46603.1 hypothetical protein B1A98_19390 [Bacillus badius]TDV98285.1 hypothetical protein B0G66_1298 [Bacillus badius]
MAQILNFNAKNSGFSCWKFLIVVKVQFLNTILNTGYEKLSDNNVSDNKWLVEFTDTQMVKSLSEDVMIKVKQLKNLIKILRFS